MADYFDTLETRDPELRERAQLVALPAQIAYAKAHAPAYARLLADVDPGEVTTRAALSRLPVVRKSDLHERAGRPAFAGFAAVGWGKAALVFASPGPLHEPQGHGPTIGESRERSMRRIFVPAI